MSLWDRVKGWVSSNAEHYIWTPVGGNGEQADLIPRNSYFRIWMSEAFLRYDNVWTQNRYPAVNATVRLNFAGDQGATFTTMSRPPEGALGPGVYGNYTLTPLLAYAGGTVELTAGLTAVEGASALAAAFSVVQDFSSLIGPPLGEALTIADKVAGGVEKLLDAGKDDIVLGLHQQFESAGGGGHNTLRPGYWALVLATEKDVRPGDLRVESDRLRIADGDRTKPFEGYDYVLIRIEGRAERDDWGFKRFEDLINQAINAHYGGNDAGYENYRNAVLAEVLTAPDLTQPDQLRVATAIKRQLDEAVASGLGASGEEAPSLADIVERHAPAPDDVAGMDATVEGVLDSA